MRKKKSRILAFVLCMAMLLGNSILSFAGKVRRLRIRRAGLSSLWAARQTMMSP